MCPTSLVKKLMEILEGFSMCYGATADTISKSPYSTYQVALPLALTTRALTVWEQQECHYVVTLGNSGGTISPVESFQAHSLTLSNTHTHTHTHTHTPHTTVRSHTIL